jgi:tetratricopeptide (TPR) repeat protein
MLNSCDFRRTLKVAITGLAILAAACIPAAGQQGGLGHDADVESSQLPEWLPYDGHNDRTELNLAMESYKKGVDAYRNGHFDAAILHFRNVLQVYPNMTLAKIYLGTSLAQKVAPGVDTPENLKNAQQAIDAFQGVLAMLPHDVRSMKQIAGINFSINRLEESKSWQKRVLAEEPKDAEATFAVGVIDGMEAQQNAQAALAQAGLKDDYEGNAKAPAEVMAKIKAQNGALVEEALLYLNQAIENRPDYDNAMTFLGLAYRRKADLDWGNEAARKDDVAKAEEWIRKAKETHKANEEKKSAGAESAKP